MPSLPSDSLSSLLCTATLPLLQMGPGPRLWGVILLVALSGFIFLFLQGRRILANQEELLTRSNGLSRRLSALERHLGEEAPTPPAKGNDLGLERIEALAERFTGMVERLDAMGDDLGRIERGQSHIAGAMESAASTAPEPEENLLRLSPEEIARDYLLREGYSRLEFLREERSERGVKILLRGMIGNELRAGHLRLDGGRVIECDLSVPTTLFP